MWIYQALRFIFGFITSILSIVGIFGLTTIFVLIITNGVYLFVYEEPVLILSSAQKEGIISAIIGFSFIFAFSLLIWGISRDVVKYKMLDKKNTQYRGGGHTM
jgi:hypothetical protein